MTCGVYQILCRVTGKSYVGSSRNMKDRSRKHFSNNHHSVPLLRAAMKKYGKENFVWRVLQECVAEELDVREAEWINLIGTVTPGGYNLIQYPQNGGQTHSQKTIDKLKARILPPMTAEQKLRAAAAAKAPHRIAALIARNRARKGQPARPEVLAARMGRPMHPNTRAALSAANTGRVATEATRQKLRQSALQQQKRPMHPNTRAALLAANLGRPCSQETRNKIGRANSGAHV